MSTNVRYVLAVSRSHPPRNRENNQFTRNNECNRRHKYAFLTLTIKNINCNNEPLALGYSAAQLDSTCVSQFDCVLLIRIFFVCPSTVLHKYQTWPSVVWHLPLNFVAIGPSQDSWMRSVTEFVLVTSMPIKYGGSGGFVWSQPKSIRRSPLMRRSHMPICLSASVPVHPVTDGPGYALPANKQTHVYKWNSIEFRMPFTQSVT